MGTTLILSSDLTAHWSVTHLNCHGFYYHFTKLDIYFTQSESLVSKNSSWHPSDYNALNPIAIDFLKVIFCVFSWHQIPVPLTVEVLQMIVVIPDIELPNETLNINIEVRSSLFW